MKRYFLLFAYFITSTCYVFTQDGFIVERNAVTLPDTTLERFEQRSPGIRQTLQDIVLSSITYLSDGLRVKGYLAIPAKKGVYPCIIYNRGGNREFGAWTDPRAALILGTMASWGYVVVASQYRGNGGGEGTEEFGGSDVNDVLNLLPLLAHESNTDTSRMGMYGWSRGGMMTYLALTKTHRMRAAIIGAGMTDLPESRVSRPGMDTVFAELIPRYAQARDSVLQARSSFYWPERLCKTTPLMLLQGSADWRVSPRALLEFSLKLYEVRHPFRLAFFEGGDHGLSEYRSEVDRLAKDFLDRYVRDRTPWPSLEPHGR